VSLPFRIATRTPNKPVVSVDGAFDAPGLNLSHWPGNRTPADLRHDLSTGIALAFARLAPPERARRSAGCVAVVNNHYDTDGALAAFAVLRPERALPLAQPMLDAAAAGDLFRCPSELAFQIDVVATAMADPVRSPIAAEFAGLTAAARWERASAELFERFPRLLAGDVAPERELWEEPLARLREDRERLASAALDELVHLDAAVWTAPAGGPAETPFDPGRHALFGRAPVDRALVLGPYAGGTSARFVLSTKSFFDLVSERAQPRPDLAALAQRLNELEGSEPEAVLAWRHQDVGGASPELWFGRAELEHYAEHAGPALAPSRLDPLAIKREVIESLRRAFVFPEE